MQKTRSTQGVHTYRWYQEPITISSRYGLLMVYKQHLPLKGFSSKTHQSLKTSKMCFSFLLAFFISSMWPRRNLYDDRAGVKQSLCEYHMVTVNHEDFTVYSCMTGSHGRCEVLTFHSSAKVCAYISCAVERIWHWTTQRRTVPPWGEPQPQQ